jgi:hypothetical protein
MSHSPPSPNADTNKQKPERKNNKATGPSPGPPKPKPIDPDTLGHAAERTMLEVLRSTRYNAAHYDVPLPILQEIITRWLLADHLGLNRTPITFFLPPNSPPTPTDIT